MSDVGQAPSPLSDDDAYALHIQMIALVHSIMVNSSYNMGRMYELYPRIYCSYHIIILQT